MKRLITIILMFTQIYISAQDSLYLEVVSIETDYEVTKLDTSMEYLLPIKIHYQASKGIYIGRVIHYECCPISMESYLTKRNNVWHIEDLPEGRYEAFLLSGNGNPQRIRLISLKD